MDSHIAQRVAHAGNLHAELLEFRFQGLPILLKLGLGPGQLILPALAFGGRPALLFGQGTRQALAFGCRLLAYGLCAAGRIPF
ncbi:MAG: hypothetical protein E6K70_22650 [Planctomycetota bacterium]|nr:MAG: hypothetical protein E6K70_22650 [Planctomycetota bacterium]